MIKAVKRFSCNQNFVPYGIFCQKGIDNLFEWFCAIEQDGRKCPYMIKTHKNLFL